jgi:uncharacterized membrane protein YadS
MQALIFFLIVVTVISVRAASREGRTRTTIPFVVLSLLLAVAYTSYRFV